MATGLDCGAPRLALGFLSHQGKLLHLPAVDEDLKGLHEWLDERSSRKLQWFQ